jgi:hypothetical protein
MLMLAGGDFIVQRAHKSTPGPADRIQNSDRNDCVAIAALRLLAS